MNQVKASLLKNAFENRFDIDNFKKFTREFFNEPEMLNGKRHIGIWREYSDYINAYYTLAKYTDNEDNNLIVLAVELKRSISIDRARSMQRNFVSKILDNYNLEAAIVAFYTEEEPSWRLSFVRLDYTLTKGGLELDLTPAKRYSYLVGQNEPNHTAQKQLLPIFQNDEHNPTLNEIENAFSVEKVTRDFFEQYKEKYLELKEHLEKNNSFVEETRKLGFEINKFAEQFAKKLMGQLAFLYFLQKKGWLGIKIVPKTISKNDLTLVYNSVDEIRKDVLKKVYRWINGNSYSLDIDLVSSEHFTEHEAEILSDIFAGNKKFDESWGNGYRQFIRDVLWKHCKENDKNFFVDYLEPFFYDALNKRRKNHYFAKFNSKIPFLNGGLFEPIEGYNWQDTNFEIPNEMFSNKREKGREADGILDIFDRFNFTMNEAEPLEKDVAIDPEMLGKIFEGLLEVSDRKSKGAFYTPREIVHYMCQESLINYLANEVSVPYKDIKKFIMYGELIRDADSRRNVGYSKEFTIEQSILDNIVEIDEALKKVRVADPAVGSGAFPLGMLNEIIRARNNITEYIIWKDKEGIFGRKYGEQFIRRWRSPYMMKWEAIKNSIFAVDIEPSAVDIAKLRLWLSIVVEQEIDNENPEPHPLPNLDMNIHVGNSLIDEYEGIKLFDKSILENNGKRKTNKSNKMMEQLRMLFNSDEVLKEMFEKQSYYFDESNEEAKRALKARIDQLRDELIIHRLRENGNEEAIEKYKNIRKQISKPYFIWELEFAKVFKEKGGFDIIIGNPPYGAKFDRETKKYLNDKYPNVPDYESADYFVCKSYNLLKNKGVLTYIIPNTILINLYAKKLRKGILEKWLILAIDNLSDIEVFTSATVRNCIMTLIKSNIDKKDIRFVNGKIKYSNYMSDDYRIVSKNVLGEYIDNWLNLFYQDKNIFDLISKLKRDSSKLTDIAEVSQGLIPYDKYRGHSPEIIKNRIWHSNYKRDETYKKELRGRDLNRYFLKWNGERWISYGDWLAAPRKPEFFTTERILIREITNPRIIASYSQEEYYNTPSIINIINFKNVSPFYVLGVINSKLLSFYHNQTSPKAKKGLFPKILVKDVRNLPIKLVDKKIEDELIKKVELMIRKVIKADEKMGKGVTLSIEELKYRPR